MVVFLRGCLAPSRSTRDSLEHGVLQWCERSKRETFFVSGADMQRRLRDVGQWGPSPRLGSSHSEAAQRTFRPSAEFELETNCWGGLAFAPCGLSLAAIYAQLMDFMVLGRKFWFAVLVQAEVGISRYASTAARRT